MVTLGSDSHKRSHTVVAVDENGCQLEERRVSATAEGHMEALGWARQWPERRWALENCRHLSRMLERDLLTAGEAVVQVSPKLMGGARRSGREMGKSKTEAIRALRRQISDEVYRRLRRDSCERLTAPNAVAA
jgi:transposase